MSIDQELEFAQKEAKRILLQGEQEAAMATVLPIRFANNIAAFEKFIPKIAAQFKDYKPKRSFRFFCTENGIPNLEWVDEGVAIYGVDPYVDCEKQITEVFNKGKLLHLNFSIEKNEAQFIHVDYLNQLAFCNKNADEKLDPLQKIPNALPLVMMFGVGLGYQLSYLYERCRVSNLFLFEPDFDLFYASLYCFEWSPFLEYIHTEGLGFHLFLGMEEKYVMMDLWAALHKKGTSMVSMALPCCHYPSPDIFKLVDLVRREIHQLTAGWGFFDDNIIGLSHCAANIANHVPFLLKDKYVADKWKNIPVFIVANGPSLDSSLEYIKCYRDKVLLISCGSTITALFKIGIKPDIHVETERTKITPDFFEKMDQPDYLRDIFFFGTDVIHPDTMKYFSRSGLCFKADEPSGILCHNYIAESRKWTHLFGVNPTVGNIGLTFACAMGFNNIYLFGVDNGYKEKSHHHSRLSVYFDNNGKELEDVSALIVSNSDPVVAGNFGDEIRAPFIYNTSRLILESTLQMYPQVRCVNCSDGAKIAGTIPLFPSELDFSDYTAIDKGALLENISQDVFFPIDIDLQNMQSHLDVSFFDSLIQLLIEEWDIPFSSRGEVADRMMQHYAYLNAVRDSKQCHIYKVLIGSINYVFSLINIMLYSYADEKSTLVVVREAICIVKKYLLDIKSTYPKSLGSIDQTNHSVLELLFKTDRE